MILATACTLRHGPYRAVIPDVQPCAAGDGLQVAIDRVHGDLQPGGQVRIEGRLWNCGSETRKLSFYPGTTADADCLRPESGTLSGVWGRARGCTHGPCPSEPAPLLILPPGASAPIGTTLELIAPCESEMEITLRYESEREELMEGYVYPDDLTTGAFTSPKVFLRR